MTEQHEPAHGEPGHVCGRETIDATDALAGILFRPCEDNPEEVTVEAWSHGLPKTVVASLLHRLADSWEAEADAEEADAARAAAAELN